ncbi:GMC oxidoreductase [Trichoderma aethiopicum]
MQTVSVDDFLRQSFDYLIIGGGTAGLVVASRLAQDGRFTVGVLEAGGQVNGREDVDIPGYFGKSLGTEIDWKFRTAPLAEVGGKTLMCPRGKALGGSSAINFMTWCRASREDYDAWERLGNPGWGWDDLLPYFKKTETFHPPSPGVQVEKDIRYDPDAFGYSGPIHISFPSHIPPRQRLWFNTLNSLGVKTNSAHAAGSIAGVWTNVNSIDPRTMTRSFATNYCALAGSNLHILTEAMVQEIVLDKTSEGYVASGVRFTHKDQEYVVSASREVILSAGTVKSPQILELSGIGNSEILSRAGIAVKVDSPMVGENLQEHKSIHAIVEHDPELENSDDLFLDADCAAAAREQFARDRTGGFSHVFGSYAFVPLARHMPQETLDKLCSRVQALTEFSAEKKAILEERLRCPDKRGQIEYIFKLGVGPMAQRGKKLATLYQILQYPFSVGSVHVQPAPSQKEDPLIDAGYFKGPAGEIDLEVMLESTRFAREIILAPSMSSVVKQLVHPPAGFYADDEAMRKWIIDHAGLAMHAVGTCALGGHAGIREGVVDERLNVFGVKGLRVVDASIMPLQIGAHIQATVYAIAEKAADMILQDAARQ